MRIGVFSKFDCAGGSEFRCVELANALSNVTGYQGVLLGEKRIPDRVLAAVKPGIEVHQGVFSIPRLDPLYTVDHLLIVNTDSKEFTTVDYWHGKTKRHSHRVDLARIKHMTFLFNFIVSPSRHLTTIEEYVEDLRIITANSKFFREIGEQDRYELVCHYPRMQLESPIAPDSITTEKSTSAQLRFGMYSKPMGNKWNDEFKDLIEAVNDRHFDRVRWDFMGVPNSMMKTLRDIPNVGLRREFAVPVNEFLRDVDVFVYFLSWGREEPWSRSAAEALTSGCPVITTAKGGNKDQIAHGNNGFLCRNTQDFIKYCLLMIEHRQRRAALRRNAIACARQFSSSEVSRKLVDFLQWSHHDIAR